MKHSWKKNIRVGKYTIGDNLPVFIIAEAGVNHNGKISHAKKLINAAVDANANAIKFQTFTTDRLVSKSILPKMYKMLSKYELHPNDFEELKDYSKEQGILFSSTPFDITSCDHLEKLHVPFFKIGSGDTNNIPLVIHAAKKKKPIFLSTGMSTTKEIKDTLKSILPFNNQVILLHCTSVYPARYDEANLRLIPILRKNFNILVGYSDHTLGYEISLASVCFGARIIEKHLTLDNKMNGPDHKTSLNPIMFKDMVKKIRNIEESHGTSLKNILARERPVRAIARRSIISIRDIHKEKVITNEDVDILRPGGGIEPKYLFKILGKKARFRIAAGKKLTWHMLGDNKKINSFP